MAKYLYPPSFPVGILKNKLATGRAVKAVCGVIGFRASKWKNLDYMSCDGSCLAVCLCSNGDEYNKRNQKEDFKNIGKANTFIDIY